MVQSSPVNIIINIVYKPNAWILVYENGKAFIVGNNSILRGIYNFRIQ